jgi:hypothetical protein
MYDIHPTPIKIPATDVETTVKPNAIELSSNPDIKFMPKNPATAVDVPIPIPAKEQEREYYDISYFETIGL